MAQCGSCEASSQRRPWKGSRSKRAKRYAICTVRTTTAAADATLNVHELIKGTNSEAMARLALLNAARPAGTLKLTLVREEKLPGFQV